MAYTDDGMGAGRRAAVRRVARFTPAGAAYMAARKRMQARKAARLGAYSDDGLGKLRLKKVFKPPKAIKKAVTKIGRALPTVAIARAVKRTVKGRAFKAAFKTKNLVKNLKIAGVVAGVAGVLVGGAFLAPALIAKLGGKALSAAAKAAALKKKAGEMLSPDATAEQITQAAAQYDALPADQKPPLEPVQAVDTSGAVVGTVLPSAYVATQTVEVPAPAEGGMTEETGGEAEAEGGKPAVKKALPVGPIAIGVVIVGGVLYMVFRKRR